MSGLVSGLCKTVHGGSNPPGTSTERLVDENSISLFCFYHQTPKNIKP